MLIDKLIRFSPEEGGSDPTEKGDPDAKGENKDESKDISVLAASLESLNERMVKLSDTVFGSARKDGKTEKELESLKTSMSDLTSLVKEHVVPKKVTAEDKLKQMLNKDKDDTDTTSISDLIKNMTAATNERFDSMADKVSQTVANKLAEMEAKLNAKDQATQWNIRLEREGIPDVYLDLIPVGDEDKLTRIKGLVESKEPVDTKTDKTLPIKKRVIDVKEPPPTGGGNDEHTIASEVMEKMRKLLKNGDLKDFESLLDDTIKKEISIDNEEITALHIKALEKEEEKKEKKRGEGQTFFS